MKKTIHFQDCVAIFEGGGVRGIAYAGSCRAAEDQGFRFHAAAGTSVGSIAAAFVSAGFHGRELTRVIGSIPLSSFTAHAARAKGMLSGCVRVAATRITWGLPHDLFQFYTARGLYSSEPIEHWVNDRLREKLGIRRPLVTFSDLPRPLIILAADLRQGGVRTWSRVTDPEVPVGFAVRCSCTIPFFFQPVEHQGQLLVDGGVLANLPIHQIGDETFERTGHLPVLAFRLVMSDVEDSGPWPDASGFLKSLSNTITSGQTAIQLRIGPPCQQVEIPTGSVSSTAFDLSRRQIAMLLRSGYRTVQQFVQNEAIVVSQSGYLKRRLEIGSRTNAIEHTMVHLKSARRCVFVAGGDLSWVWEMCPLLWVKAFQGVSVRILTDKEVDRRTFLALCRIGCEVRQTRTRLEAYGTFVDPGEDDSVAIIVERREGRLNGRTLTSQRDRGVCLALMDRFDSIWEAAQQPLEPSKPGLEQVPGEVVTTALRGCVRQYQDSDLQFGEIAVEEIFPLTAALEVVKLRRAESVAKMYQARGLALFLPAVVPGCSWLLAPPVVENHDDRLVLIDGIHRIEQCRRAGVKAVGVIMVKNVGEPPPAKVLAGWDNAVPLPDRLQRNDRYSEYDGSRWRNLQAAWTEIGEQMCRQGIMML